MLIKHVNDLQKRLTKKYIQPNLSLIIRDLLSLRLVLDKEFESYLGKNTATQGNYSFDFDRHVHRYGEAQLDEYPLGLCNFISDLIRTYILLTDNPFGLKGVDLIKTFHKVGGVFEPLWGEVRGECFQNAFQIGTMYFDVANDTVYLDKPKVICAPINNCEFSNIDSFQMYASIMRSYWGHEVYINDCFPELIPFFPLLRKQSDESHLLIDSKWAMSSLIWRVGLQSVIPFLENASFSRDTLTAPDKSEISTNLKRLKGSAQLLGKLRFEPLEKQDLIERYLWFKNHSTEQFRAHYQECLHAVQTFNKFQFLWSKKV